METTASCTRDTKAILRNKIVTFLSKPQNIILLVFGIVLTFSTVAPIVAIVRDTFQIHPGTIDAHLTGKASGYSVANYVDLFTSRLAMTNLWKPLLNTVILSVLCDFHPVWWFFCLPGDENQHALQKVFKLDFHFSVHHAAVDPRRRMAAYV